MTPESQRIAIAEACGWTKKTNNTMRPMWHNPKGVPIGFIPDYLNDLNAMHEAEKILTEYQDREYRSHLILATGSGEHRATATQRAEEFLRTLNIWTV